ncbi:unnamed protein product, partial [Rotaria magnacalcarata]
TTRLGGYEFEEKQYKTNLIRRQQFIDEYVQSSSQTIDKANLSSHLDRQIQSGQKDLMEKRLFYQQKEKTIQQDVDKCQEQR